jgi:regulator of protease activity HflC (stomatin/prohibitin superfamily)
MIMTIAEKVTDNKYPKEDYKTDNEASDRRLEKESLIFVAKTGYQLLRIAFIFLLIIFLIGNSYWIPEGYIAIQTRFGSFVENNDEIVKGPGGPYFALPYPIDKVIKVPTSIQTISINDAFITEMNQKVNKTTVSQNTINSNVTGLLITGDKNLVQGTWEINYRIEYSPEKNKSLVKLESFVKNTGTMDNANRIIKKISEQAIIKVVAGTTVSDFVTGRINLNLISELIQKMADSLHSGITVMNVSASHYGPPSILVNDFQAANQAESEKALQIENAIRYRMTTLSEAAGENWEELLNAIDNYQSSKPSYSECKTDSSMLNKVNEILFSGRIGGIVALQIDSARIDKTRIIEKSRSFESQFKKLLPAYRLDPRIVKNQLFQDVMLEVLSGPLVKVRWLPSGARLYMSDLKNED